MKTLSSVEESVWEIFELSFKEDRTTNAVKTELFFERIKFKP